MATTTKRDDTFKEVQRLREQLEKLEGAINQRPPTTLNEMMEAFNGQLQKQFDQQKEILENFTNTSAKTYNTDKWLVWLRQQLQSQEKTITKSLELNIIPSQEDLEHFRNVVFQVQDTFIRFYGDPTGKVSLHACLLNDLNRLLQSYQTPRVNADIKDHVDKVFKLYQETFDDWYKLVSLQREN